MEGIMMIFNFRKLKGVCIFFCILMSGCMSSHWAARDYYFKTLYEDFKNYSNPSNESKQNTSQEEIKRAEETLKKREWSLQDCINLSIINEERLKIQGESYYQTKWLFYQALASWLPSASLEETYTNYDKEVVFGGKSTFFDKTEYWLKVRQPIFNAGREVVTLTNSQHLSELKKYELKQYKDVLILAVADAFYQVLDLKNELDALEVLHEYTKNHFEMVKAREEAEIAHRKDTLLAEATLFDIKARIARTKNLFNNARLNLQLLVGRPLPQEFIDSVSVSEVPKDVKEVITTALEDRYEVKIADTQIKLATAEVDLAKASYLPNVNLDWTRYLRSRGGLASELDWTLLLTISLPFDNGGKYAKLQETYSKLRQANLEKERLVKVIQNEVEKAYRDLQAVQSDIEAREKGLSAAKETADIVSEEYKVGTATNVEVLFTKNSFEQAKMTLERSKIELKLAYLRLKFAIGKLSKEF